MWLDLLEDLLLDVRILEHRLDHQIGPGGRLGAVGRCDQRQQLDVSYGKTARFVLMFDDVQAKVQKVSLRSPSGPLDIEDIMLISSGTAPGDSH